MTERTAIPRWEARGDYLETCSCDFLCPCITSNLSAPATRETCRVAMAFRIDQGQFGDVTLGGLAFVLVAETPARMADGNWKVGLIVDASANAAQREAVLAIAGGKAGGPLAAMAGLIGTFLGVESRPIRVERDGLRWRVTAGELLDQGVAGVPSAVSPDEPLYIDNTLHPANPRLALAHATHSRLAAFGIHWGDPSGKNNGHFAPFHWRHA